MRQRHHSILFLYFCLQLHANAETYLWKNESQQNIHPCIWEIQKYRKMVHIPGNTAYFQKYFQKYFCISRIYSPKEIQLDTNLSDPGGMTWWQVLRLPSLHYRLPRILSSVSFSPGPLVYCNPLLYVLLRLLDWHDMFLLIRSDGWDWLVWCDW